MINKNGLVTRLTVVVLFSAIAVGILSSQIFYQVLYENELQQSKKNIHQVYQTISATASIASYLEDRELAKEVINGLLKSDIIASAAISSANIHVITPNYQKSEQTSEFHLYSPFEPEQKIGVIYITPDLATIKLRAEKLSKDNIIALSIQGVIAILVLMMISYVIVTKPIISIAKRLHKTKLGTAQRVPVPLQHKQSELGLLVRDINNILMNAEQQIKKERHLRNEVEVLSRHFKLLFENSNSPIVLTEPDGNIILYNHAFLALLKAIKVPFKSSFGPYLLDLFDNKKLLTSTVEIAFGNNETASGEFELVNHQKDKAAIWMQVVINTAIAEDYRQLNQVTLHDISKRKHQLEKLSLTAQTDKLTMLLNRRGAEAQIQHFISKKKTFALVLLDLNGFKPINDKYGHDIGDEILVHVSQTLTAGLRRRDILSRWGGDEFVIAVPEVDNNDMAEIAKKIQQCVATPYQIKDASTMLAVSCSIGIAFYPSDATELKGLIDNADKAMYHAKSNKNKLNVPCYAFYQHLAN